MALTGTQIATEARDALFDTDKIRWQDADILRYINDASRAIVDIVPSAYTRRSEVTLDTGEIQQVPNDGLVLLRVARNVAGRAIRRVDLDDMNAGHPNWVTEAPSAQIRQYMFDPDTPTQYLVYPPSDGSSQVEITYAVVPGDITSLNDTLPLRDTYKLAYVSYTLFRAYARDSDYAANRDLSSWYFQQFAQGLGIKFEARVSEMPTNEDPA